VDEFSQRNRGPHSREEAKGRCGLWLKVGAGRQGAHDVWRAAARSWLVGHNCDRPWTRLCRFMTGASDP
jgi:hypothetical protein